MKCFVIMPFDPDLDDVYTMIKAAGESAMPEETITVRRLDEIRRSGRISDDLIREMNEAEFCIADLSGNNPNVIWEAGYAMALNKPIVFISQNIDQLPFDIRDIRTIPYNRLALTNTLQFELARAIRQTLAEHEVSSGEANIFLFGKDTANIAEEFRLAKKISILGVTLTSTVRRLADFEAALESGCNLRILLSALTQENLTALSFRSYRIESPEEVREKIQSNLRALKPLRERFQDSASFTIRTIPFLPTCALTIIEGANNKSTIQVKLFTFKEREHPRFELNNVTHKNWFRFFLNQFEEMWKLSSELPL